MKMLEGKVAAVTGAASGLGRAMALAFAGEGMHAALADVDEPGLKSTLNEVQSRGVRAFAMRVDVSRYQEVESFCSKAIAQFGATHVVCNNAGVSPLGAVWENTLADWQWILGVNLWGVIHGVRAFVPRLLAQGEGHVVNTASVAGLISPPGMGAYNVTKHAVVALSESLYHDLRLRGSPVGVSVLCPAYVPTGIADSERNRPRELLNPAKSPSKEETMLKKAVASGKLSADDVARAVVAAVKEERFYVLTHPRIKGAIRARMEDILDERAPRNPLALQASPGNSSFRPSAMVWMAIAASSRPSSRVAMLSPVVPIFGPTASAMRSNHQSTPHTSAMHTMSAATCTRPSFCALMIVVLIAPGPASSGTASGTTPERSPDSSSLASAWVWRISPTLAFSIASAIRRSTRPPPTWKAGTLAPITRSKPSPKSAEPASTANTVSVTMCARRRRPAGLAAEVTLRKIGTARNGSRTAVSVTRNRRYSWKSLTSSRERSLPCDLR